MPVTAEDTLYHLNLCNTPEKKIEYLRRVFRVIEAEAKLAAAEEAHQRIDSVFAKFAVNIEPGATHVEHD